MVLVVIRFNKFEAGHRGAFRCYQRGVVAGMAWKVMKGCPTAGGTFLFCRQASKTMSPGSINFLSCSSLLLVIVV